MVLRRVLVGAILFVATSVVHGQSVRDTIGPLEKTAAPSSPENPIPRRTSAPPARQPQEWQGRSGRGLVRLQATLDTSGRVAEIRNLIDPLVQFGNGITVDDATRQTIADAMVKSATAALSQWTYDAPAAPITFPVLFNFNAGAEPVATQDPPPPLALPARGGGSAAPPWPAAEGAIRVGSTLRAPQQTKRVNPAYPRAAIDERVTGIVILEAVIGVDGTVKDARVLRSVPLLDQAALDAVKQWEYAPSLMDGKPVPIVMTVTVTFTLDRPPGAGPLPASGPLTVAPWPAAQGAVRVGGTIKPPVQTKKVNPVYPRDAQAERVSGLVILEILIGTDGQVKDTRVLRSSPLLDKAAVEAVRKWEYEPTIVNGKPVSVVMTVTTTFTLK